MRNAVQRFMRTKKQNIKKAPDAELMLHMNTYNSIQLRLESLFQKE
ncbi:hypothetical protein KKG19_06125 [Patescibacteria group bacterium]|nr:hypothetical protein [Patescibacteria group bacterium]